MNDWRKPCEHGEYVRHYWGTIGFDETEKTLNSCPGGAPVTAADLKGGKVWWCEVHNAQRNSRAGCWKGDVAWAEDCRVVERLLIPIPDTQPATEGT